MAASTTTTEYYTERTTTANYSTAASAMLFIYDFMCTFPDEVDLYWGKRATGASVLFWVLRYSALACNVYNMCAFFPTRYASIGIAAWDFSAKTVPNAGCLGTYRSDSANPHLSCFILADVVLIATTTQHLRGLWNLSSSSFARVILRDGTMYFVLLCTLNITHIALSLLSTSGRCPGMSNVGPFTQSITAALVSRFLLHLQHASRKTRVGPTSQDSGLSGSRIAGLTSLGSLGFCGNVDLTEERFDGDWETFADGSEATQDDVSPFDDCKSTEYSPSVYQWT
ncbi:uncharacterized protein BXZ73DRAFT_99744 [Epithele typhae]|uniref:uncharacterized protein n=1 Tax=Epithele typhae TaxID=378194 RepID=UPI0020073744|nr:uncharacterized protein BXZ73DRAFT_99744 [Epithele typhae]KAH9939067.1 hypothetical protein BXZ73DRAFT_99744 [Epithele typhae]